MFNPEAIFHRLLYLPLFILALSVHEWAHAWMAHRLGDDTARLQGRLTLNPLAHIDPIGTIVMPVFIGFIGWAKPVPFTPVALSRKVSMRTGIMLVALAGPVSNLIQAFVGAILFGLVAGIAFRASHGGDIGWFDIFQDFAVRFISLNCMLAVFNLIPINPLDGSKVLYGILPRKLGDALIDNEFLTKWGFLILMVIFVAASPVAEVLLWPAEALTHLLFRFGSLIAGLIA